MPIPATSLRRRLVPQLLAAPLLLAATAVAAEDLTQMIGLTACRSTAETVDVAFSYEGSACEAVGEASVTTAESAATATFPTERTAEICTQQVVPVDVSQRIAVATEARTLEVIRLDPDGNPAASATTPIMPICEQG